MAVTSFKVPSQHLPDSCQENTKIPQDSVSLDRGSNPEPPEAGELSIVTFGDEAPTVTLLLDRERERGAQQLSQFYSPTIRYKSIILDHSRSKKPSAI